MSTLSNLANPFSEESRLAWHEYLLSSGTNRFRPALERMILIRDLLTSARKASNSDEYKLKYVAKKKYHLDQGTLTIHAGAGGTLQTVLTDHQAYDIIVRSHLNLNHTGTDKTMADIGATYYGITRQEVSWLLQHCSTCVKNRTQKQWAPIRPIVVSELFGRVQIDLIDFSMQPDGPYK
jgi:hypothetical protein